MTTKRSKTQTAYRDRLLAEGAARLDVILSAEAQANLLLLTANGDSKTAVIERLLRRAAARV